ncbi:MAG: SDR family oxidoreductase [Deltaproteobacteria bacterium]|nr:SDR family oxidoreductase [Deltaproteobacteria bacterium]
MGRIGAHAVALARSGGECRVALLEGKIGLVTGGAQGLGAAVARLAASEGSKIVLGDVQAERGEAVAKEIAATGGEAYFLRTDVSDFADCEALVAAAIDRFGGLDWACNNAVSGAGDFGPIDTLEESNWDRTLEVCLKGVFLGMKAQLPALLERGGGSIVNVTTASAFKGEAMLSAYAAAKGGVHTLTMTGAAEYSARGIRINSVAPGGMETPAIQRYFEKFPAFKDKTVATHAMRRLGSPEEVAEPIIWLASDRASFVTGSCLVCDGGALINSHLL